MILVWLAGVAVGVVLMVALSAYLDRREDKAEVDERRTEVPGEILAVRGYVGALCDYCGAMHAPGHCGVRDATDRILANYTPRGMTARVECPTCHKDGRWKWGPRYLVCMDCGTPEPKIAAEATARLRARECPSCFQSGRWELGADSLSVVCTDCGFVARAM